MPTNKQERLAEEIVKNSLLDKPLNKGELLEKVGYSPNLATTYPGKVLNNPTVVQLVAEKQESMLEALEQTGVTSAFLARKVKQLLDKEQVIVRNNVTTGLIETVETGEIDVQAVKIGMENAFKLGVGGGYKDLNSGVTNQTINVNFINNPEVQAKVREFEEDLKQQLISKPNAASN